MKKAAFTICFLLLAGCSTIINGPTQDIVVTSNPPGAIVTPTDYKCWIKTPGIITLDRTNNTILTARLYGYEDSKQEIKCEPIWSIVGIIGEFFISNRCTFLLASDLSTGSLGQLTPNEVHFEPVLKKKK